MSYMLDVGGKICETKASAGKKLSSSLPKLFKLSNETEMVLKSKNYEMKVIIYK